MVNIGEYVRTYNGFSGAVVRKVRDGNNILVHIRNDIGDIHICQENMICEAFGNCSCDMVIIQGFINEVTELRRQNLALENERKSYRDLLYGTSANLTYSE